MLDESLFDAADTVKHICYIVDNVIFQAKIEVKIP